MEQVDRALGDGVGVGVVVDRLAVVIGVVAAAHVHVGDLLARQAGEEVHRIALQVAGIGVNVGNIEEQPAAGAVNQFPEKVGVIEFPLVGRVVKKGRDIFERQGN